MNFLLTNDDGIDAPGIAALESALQGIGTITVVAPNQGYSGCGHQVTRGPIRVEKLDERRFKVFGTPADCARLGVTKLAPETQVVLSGINEGGNLGVDIYMSGTVAAVREAAWLGVPGIAFSQYIKAERPRNWEKSAAMARRVLEELRDQLEETTSFWNVNFPDVDTPVSQLRSISTFAEPKHMPVGFEEVAPGNFELRSDYRNRDRVSGSDVEVCFGGGISISKIIATP